MSKKIIYILLLLLFIAETVYCQTFTVSGTVIDGGNKMFLTGANVYLQENLNGASSDVDGFYSFKEKSGTYTLVCLFMGYDTVRQKIVLNKDLQVNFKLKEAAVAVEGVEIKVQREDKNVRSTQVGTIELPIKQIEKIPVMFGEKDIIKTIQLLPGIQAGGEGNNAFYVRGGGADQNLILIDGATVYNPSHAAGFFSVFNADVINSAEIIKGGMPPEYGGRMSSVLNITTLDGDMDSYKAKAGIGLLSSHAQVEGPIQRGKSSFNIAARRTYADVILRPFVNGSSMLKGLQCYFYDINGKLAFRLSENDNITASFYHGKDVFNFNSDLQTFSCNMNWQNTLGVIRWNHIFNKRLYLDVSANVTNYQLNVGGYEQAYNMTYSSAVTDYTGKADLTYSPDTNNAVKFGVSYTHHVFSPTALQVASGSTQFNTGDPQYYYARDIIGYVQHDLHVTPWLEVLYGLRYNYFAQTGPFTRYVIDNVFNMENVDSTYYKKGETVKAYNLFEPRINIRFQLAADKSIKASYTLNRQCLNLAALMDISLPTDIWLPSTDLLTPQLCHQFSTGYFQNFKDNTIETSFEVYYKKMKYMLDVNPDANIISIFQTNLDYGFISGTGQSYGMELFVNKTAGKFTGWVAYTLSWTTRNFDEIMNGETFYARYDRRHDVSIMLNYELNDKWDFSTVWVFSSGNAATIPNAFYIINGNMYIEYGEHNAWRMPDYHRLDISATWKIFDTKHLAGDLNFSVYNVYNRKNPYIVSYTVDRSSDSNIIKVKAYQISLFPVLPSVSFNMQFK
ncbi:MAG: TonB-dependent receptor [Bacteroidales bacterium]|jgi:hypothetical protein|nr:TonB-dependent receptor [Bacteroidales bacterium]MDD2205382.1 TonB-dependent receptor [Bacteroidales bacterium]MDD3152102.1 TonB-dependent receptor [Bacteroidales bacterium]MDD3914757.1 TonB-dependent receptor [Bacteroidales bacterium]MDD4634184.1 TonB-dependent receptor [Bacteroidales bacterium]